MKKWLMMLLSILLVAAMALSFTACGDKDKDDKKEYDKDSIVGDWECTLNMGEIMGLDFKVDAKVTLEAKKDGTYTLSMDPDSILKSLQKSGDEFIEYILQMQGVNMSADEFLEMAGMSEKEFFEQIADSMDTESFNTTGEYTYEDGILTIDGEEIECEYTGDELIFENEGIEFKFTR